MEDRAAPTLAETQPLGTYQPTEPFFPEPGWAGCTQSPRASTPAITRAPACASTRANPA